MSEEKCKYFKSSFECSIFTVGSEPSYCDGNMDCGCKLGFCLLENKRLREALEKIVTYNAALNLDGRNTAQEIEYAYRSIIERTVIDIRSLAKQALGE